MKDQIPETHKEQNARQALNKSNLKPNTGRISQEKQ